MTSLLLQNSQFHHPCVGRTRSVISNLANQASTPSSQHAGMWPWASHKISLILHFFICGNNNTYPEGELGLKEAHILTLWGTWYLFKCISKTRQSCCRKDSARVGHKLRETPESSLLAPNPEALTAKISIGPIECRTDSPESGRYPFQVEKR